MTRLTLPPQQAARAAALAASNNAFIVMTDLGLGGLRIAVKDSIDIAGLPTSMGSPCLAATAPASAHAHVIERLLMAGCHIVGKTNLHELAYGVTGVNHWSGTPVNPRAPARVPGGSSSGSAVAVAMGLVDAALGTDTGGSIRIPAACCGVYGLKPSYGRISRSGVHPARSTLDCVGPLARELPMLEHVMTLIDPTFRPLAAPSQVTIGWLAVNASPRIAVPLGAALATADIAVRPVCLPAFSAAFAAALTIISAETWTAFGQLIRCEHLGADVRARLLRSREVSGSDVAAAERVRRAFSTQIDELLAQVHALALPTLPDFPLTLDAASDAQAALQSSALVRPFNLSGHPAISLPRLVDGLPAGLQLVGRAGEDALLCALARTVVARLPTSPSNV